MKKTTLVKHEDFWAIWIGGLFLMAGILLFFSSPPKQLKQLVELDKKIKEASEKPFRTIAWYDAIDQQKAISGANTGVGKWLKWLTGKPGSWTLNPFESFGISQAKAAETRQKAQERIKTLNEKVINAKTEAVLAENLAKEADFKNDLFNQLADTKITVWQKVKADKAKMEEKTKTRASNKVGNLLVLFLLFGLLFGLGLQIMGITKVRYFFSGFAVVFFIGIMAYFIAGQSDLKTMGLGYALWAIVLGLVISNTIGIPYWLRPALATSFYIKTGLVLLGGEILFGKILDIGLPGLFVAWVVTPIVLITTYWFGQKVLKISSKSLNMTISADMSVCGVSAAVATAAACRATKEELTLSIGLSMIFTSIMMVVLPGFINWVGIPEVLGGAWIGGTIDATGAVVAAGAFLGEKALSVAATIKMIQNVLIGLVAFGVAIYFTTKVDNVGQQKIGLDEIWKRFPKFILGFIGASIFFSIIYEFLGTAIGHAMIDQGVIGSYSKNLRGWLFCLAFVSIGLSTNFKELKQHFSGGKPLILYVVGQCLNLGLTLLMAYIMFYLVFPDITAQI